jgi:F-type H+-transporting ATPase subunit delta
LLAVAAAESDVNRAADELSRFLALAGEHEDLDRALTAPGVPPRARANLVGALAERMALSPPVAKLLTLLADRGRLRVLPEIAAAYNKRLLAYQHIVLAHVTSAMPLDSAQIAGLATTLSAATGARVQVDADVDPALIGGLVTRVGSTVYDGSVRAQLERLKQQLVEGA